MPVSDTLTSAESPSAEGPIETAMRPSKVNLKALETRFSSTFSHIS